jgi:hypothetical protein
MAVRGNGGAGMRKEAEQSIGASKVHFQRCWLLFSL